MKKSKILIDGEEYDRVELDWKDKISIPYDLALIGAGVLGTFYLFVIDYKLELPHIGGMIFSAATIGRGLLGVFSSFYDMNKTSEEDEPEMQPKYQLDDH